MADVITVEQLRDHLGYTSDAWNKRLAPIVELVNGFLASETGREFASKTRTAELYAGNGTNVIALKHFPVTSLTALKLDGTALSVVDGEDVVLDKARGLLYRMQGTWPDTIERIIDVTYVGGLAVPAELVGAALALAAVLSLSSDAREPVGQVKGDVAQTLKKALAGLPTAAAVIERYTDGARGFVQV